MFYTSFCYLLPSSTLGTSPKKDFQRERIEKFAPKAWKRLQNLFFKTKKILDFAEFIFEFGDKWLYIAEFNIAI